MLAKNLVIIPTYNERETLPRLLPALLAFPGHDALVVDDDSPDGTGAWMKDFTLAQPRAHLLARNAKSGLGTAYLDGFRWALARDYGTVITMDGDLSHSPRHLPAFFEALETHDVVAGSRWMPGGGAEGWDWKRLALSRAANAFARGVLGSSCRDLTGGFTAYRRAAVEALVAGNIRSEGYAFQIETKFICVKKGFSLKEIPITFTERTGGRSKFSFGIAIEALARVLVLRLARGAMAALLLLASAASAVSAAENAGLRRLFEREPSFQRSIQRDFRQVKIVVNEMSEKLVLPTPARLYFSHGTEERSPVPFELTVTPESRDAKDIRLEYVSYPSGWKDEAVDLAALAGQRVRITFRKKARGRFMLNAPLVAGTPSRPNVILIGIDTLRADHLGCYGYSRETSPAVDRLAARGTVFENAYAQTSWTLPSFVSLFTGLYPDAHGVTDKSKKMKKGLATLPRLMRDAGYFTIGLHGGGYVDPFFGFDEGFDAYRLSRGLKNLSNPTERNILRWVRERAAGSQPFFLFIHSYDTHLPYEGRPAEHLSLFTDPAYPDPYNLKKWRSMFGTFKQRFVAADIAHLAALYDGCVRYVDDQLAKLFALLEETGLDENTYVIFISDHGEEFHDHGDFSHQITLYEEVVRVPLIVAGPGVPKGKRVTALVETVDVLPTLAELLNQPAPDRIDGQSFAGHLSADAADAPPAKPHSISQLDDGQRRIVSLRTEEWTYVENWSLKRRELYDRRTDRAEKNNLSKTHRAEMDRLAAQYRAATDRKKKTVEKTGRKDKTVLERLRSLGYAN